MNPKLPSRIGKVTHRKDISGNPMEYRVLDEIVHIPSSNQGKAIYLQKLEFEPDHQVEFRFCYYMIGKKGRGKDRWLWGQFAPMIRQEDLEAILLAARAKGWIS